MYNRYFMHFFRVILVPLMTLFVSLPVLAQTPDLTWVDQLPVLELTYDVSKFNTSTFVPATLTYYDAEGSTQYSCTVRHRGGSSTVFAKPSYSLKFYDARGESLDVSFLGMRTDNYWILDAASGDHSKMRNRVSMNLWLDFSHKPYHQSLEPNAINGTRGHFVEVHVNGKYFGLYCLSERIDRKQLKLKKYKTDSETGEPYYRGLLYKALYSNNTRTPFFYYNQNSPSSDLLQEWDGMKCEYPDVTEGEPWSWTPLITSVNKVAFTSAKFRNNVETYFDLPVFFDYMLYLDLMLALDNVGKNFYCWFYDLTSDDVRLGYTPWDMDATWGENWAGEPLSPDRAMNNRSNFHTRMKESYKGYADTLSTRYAELRQTYWAEDTLFAYFDRYFQLFEETGVMDREIECWKNSNCRLRPLAEEKQIIHQWIHDRLVYMDEEYAYDPESIDVVKKDSVSKQQIRFNLFGQQVRDGASGWVVQSGRIQLQSY